ncbi:uncharacterized protein LOC130663275 isoform X2 [Microplitis mediator]|uniref:uncharacterized protein LOC130663275 isoform X2 n=1 Tax=Microplitis mediator TaxID=375433 RepID=UPI00255498BD|nr:uncharacterized protein LOC130663275 isoform X2 [Microplitis mediator]
MRTKCSLINCPSRKIRREVITTESGRSSRLFSLFSVPTKDLKLRDEWSKIMNYEFKDRDVLCEFHFPEEFINRDCVIKLPDGIHRIQHHKVSLKRGAMPVNKKIVFQKAVFCKPEEILNSNNNLSRFKNSDNLQKNNSTNKENSSTQLQFNNDHIYAQKPPNESPTELIEFSNPVNNSTSKESGPELLEPEVEIENFNPNLNKFIEVELPNSWRWTKVNDDVLIAASYDPISFIQRKSMVIRKNLVENKLSVQAIIDGHTVDVPELKSVETIEDVISNVNMLQTLLVCSGVSETVGRPKDCIRYVKQKPYGNIYGRTRCKNCDDLRKKTSRSQRVSKKKNGKIKELKQTIKTMELENLKLQGAVNKLEAKLNYYSKQSNV